MSGARATCLETTEPGPSIPTGWRSGSTREWRKTRERILARDGYRFMFGRVSAARGRKLLEVHHIYSEESDVLLVPDDELRTVCRKHNPRGG